MKIKVKSLGDLTHTTLEAEITGHVTISEVFTGVGIVTEDGAVFGVALRDSGLEIKCPDGTLVGIKRFEGGEIAVSGKPPVKGQTFIERNCEFLG
jgi:hypothetical protein